MSSLFQFLARIALWIRENAWHIVAPLITAFLQWLLSQIPTPKI